MPWGQNITVYTIRLNQSKLVFSGLYKVPIKTVAEAVFDALVDFDSNLPTRGRSLKEVHIVDVNTSNIHALKAILYCKFRQFIQT